MPFQSIRPVRVYGFGELGVITRYFTDLDASAAQYYELSTSVTVTRIVMTAWSSDGDSTGLPGSPTITPGVLQTLDYSFSGTVDYIGRVANQYFDGIIADVKLYDGSDLIADFPLDEQIPVDGIISNRVAGNPGAPSHMTAMNLLPSDSERYEQIDVGWIGEEIWPSDDQDVSLYGDATYTNGIAHVTNSGTIDPTGIYVTRAVSGNTYRFEHEVFDFSSGKGLFKIGTDVTGVTIDQPGWYSSDITANGSSIEIKRRAGFSVDFKSRKISVKRRLRIAS